MPWLLTQATKGVVAYTTKYARAKRALRWDEAREGAVRGRAGAVFAGGFERALEQGMVKTRTAFRKQLVENSACIMILHFLVALQATPSKT
jgi:hypothetical protein